mgnify:CR=1 FL=1
MEDGTEGTQRGSKHPTSLFRSPSNGSLWSQVPVVESRRVLNERVESELALEPTERCSPPSGAFMIFVGLAQEKVMSVPTRETAS